MGILLLGLTSAYAILLLYLAIIWSRMSTTFPCEIPTHSFSIIIPIRNEANNLPALLESLEKLNYPHEMFEVIFINDHSTDHGIEIIDHWKQHSAIRISRLELDKYQGSPKKAALTLGIAHSLYDFIVTTDGDCEVPDQWLQLLDASYQRKTTHMVIGAVNFNQYSIFASLQALEMLVLAGVSASMIKLGRPLFGNGAHLSYRKESFMKLGGFKGNEHIASGDDEFMLKKMVSEYGNRSIRYLKNEKAMVITKANHNLLSFWYQRIRWASKWKAHNDIKHAITSIFIWLANGLIVLSIPLVLTNQLPFSIFAVIWLVKFSSETGFCYTMGRYFDIKINLVALLILGLLYPLYVVLFGLAANFSKYQWKGRIYYE